MRLDPWASSQSTDYARMKEQFGLEDIELDKLPNPGKLHRRGIVFSHRDLDLILDAKKEGKPFGVLTGLMPSGKMHLGHKMVIDQVKWFQDLGADVMIAVADLEALATRGMTLEECREIAMSEYVLSYAAMGLDPDKTEIYFQSERSVVQELGFTLGKNTNLSEMEALYGFTGETNLAHVQAPLVQAGDIIHPQLEEYGGLRPIVVPVGIDQDPHLRFTRGLVSKSNWFNVKFKGSKMTVGLSVRAGNETGLGENDDGKRNEIVEGIIGCLKNCGMEKIEANAKQGRIECEMRDGSQRSRVRMDLCAFEREIGGPGMIQPSSTYHRFAVGLTGDKMSSSMPETTLFLSDTPDEVEKKIKAAFSGGKETLEEHREKGGDPDIDVAFQYLMFFFEDDDNELERIHTEYKSGEMLTGELKAICIEKANGWLEEHRKLRAEKEGIVEQFLA